MIKISDCPTSMSTFWQTYRHLTVTQRSIVLSRCCPALNWIDFMKKPTMLTSKHFASLRTSKRISSFSARRNIFLYKQMAANIRYKSQRRLTRLKPFITWTTTCKCILSFYFTKQHLINVHFRIGVSSTGKIYEICTFTKTIRLFAEWDDCIQDLVILQANDNDVQLLLQTKSNDCCNLKIVDFPCKLLSFPLLELSNWKVTVVVQQWSATMSFRYHPTPTW